jgi:hypothetical protein
MIKITRLINFKWDLTNVKESQIKFIDPKNTAIRMKKWGRSLSPTPTQWDLPAFRWCRKSFIWDPHFPFPRPSTQLKWKGEPRTGNAYCTLSLVPEEILTVLTPCANLWPSDETSWLARVKIHEQHHTNPFQCWLVGRRERRWEDL